MKRLAIIAAAGLAMAAAANPVAQWFHFGDAAVAPGPSYDADMIYYWTASGADGAAVTNGMLANLITGWPSLGTTQATASARATLIDTGGVPFVRFDGGDWYNGTNTGGASAWPLYASGKRMTIAAVVRGSPDVATTAKRTIINQWTGNDRLQLYRWRTRWVTEYIGSPLIGGLSSAGDIAIGNNITSQWWLVVCRFSDAGLSIDINGTNRATMAATNWVNIGNTDRYTGLSTSGVGGINEGSVDDMASIRVWTNDIGAARVTNLWNEIKGSIGY
jgi:hypothetical protein